MKPACLREPLARSPEPTARSSATHQTQPPLKGILRRPTGVARARSKSAKISWLWRPRMLTVHSLDEAEKVELFWSQGDLSEVTCGCCGGRCREREVSVAQNPKGQRDLLCSGCAEEQPRHLVSTKPGRGSVGWLKIYPEPAPLFQEEEDNQEEEEQEEEEQEERQADEQDEEEEEEEQDEEQEERQADEEEEEEEEDEMPMSARLLQALEECSKLPRPSILRAQPTLNRTCGLLRVSFEGVRKVVEGSEFVSPETKDALFWNSERLRSSLCARCGGFQSMAESFVAESWHGEMDMICKDCSSDWPGHLLSSVPGAISAGWLKLQPSISCAFFDELAEYESRKVDMDVRDEDSTTEAASDTETVINGATCQCLSTDTTARQLGIHWDLTWGPENKDFCEEAEDESTPMSKGNMTGYSHSEAASEQETSALEKGREDREEQPKANPPIVQRPSGISALSQESVSQIQAHSLATK
ncbi:unnamed protein product, partial [Symbiodinium sp. CCMP2456]